MSTAVAVNSLFNPQATVYVDPWAANPLVDDAVQAVPDLVNLALTANGEPPTMFDSGDLPPFTASGIDPQMLARLPWRLRHAAALEPSAAAVLANVEKYGHDDIVMGQTPGPGLEDYVGRFRGWLAGQWTNPNFAGADPTQRAEAEGDLYGSLFGTQDAARAVKLAAVNAQGDAFSAARDWRQIAGDPSRAQR